MPIMPQLPYNVITIFESKWLTLSLSLALSFALSLSAVKVYKGELVFFKWCGNLSLWALLYSEAHIYIIEERCARVQVAFNKFTLKIANIYSLLLLFKLFIFNCAFSFNKQKKFIYFFFVIYIFCRCSLSLLFTGCLLLATRFTFNVPSTRIYEQNCVCARELTTSSS